MGENSFKQCNWQGLNLQNIQTTHKNQHQQLKKNPIEKLAEDLNRYFFKENIQRASKDMKRCPISLIIREMKMRTTVSYHLTPVRMVIIHKSTNNKCQRGCEEKRTLLYCWWQNKLLKPLWRAVWRFLRKLNTQLSYDPVIPLLSTYLDKTTILKYVCTFKFMFIAALSLQPRHGNNISVY